MIVVCFRHFPCCNSTQLLARPKRGKTCVRLVSSSSREQTRHTDAKWQRRGGNRRRWTQKNSRTAVAAISAAAAAALSNKQLQQLAIQGGRSCQHAYTKSHRHRHHPDIPKPMDYDRNKEGLLLFLAVIAHSLRHHLHGSAFN